MIKINLAKQRKSGGGGGGLDLKNIDIGKLFSGLLKGGGGGEKMDLKNSPILKLIIVCAAIYFLDDTIAGMKKEELGKIDSKTQKVELETQRLQAELAKVKGFEEKKKQLQAYEQAIRTKLETLGKLMEGRTLPPRLLLQLSKDMPPEVWITDFKLGEQEISILGQTPSFNQVSDFMKALSSSNYFTDVQLKGIEENSQASQEQKIQNFTVTAKRSGI